MPELAVSLGLSPREPLDRFIDLLRTAEGAGVDAAWIVDSQLAMKDAYVALALLARETETLRVGPGVTNAVTRHNTVVANAMSTIASYAPGRVLVGFGAGDSAVYPLGKKPMSIEACRNSVAELRALLRGDKIDGAAGPIELSFAVAPTPPVYLAASQPRMLRLAGEVADGVIIMGPSDPSVVAAQLAAVDAGAVAAGRDPAAVHRDLWVTMAVGARAVEDVKSWASAQARWLSKWKELPPHLARFRSEMDQAAADYDFATHLSRHADHAGSVSDELASSLAVAGDVGHCTERLRSLTATGVDRVTITLLSGGREQRLEQLVDVWNRVG